MKKLLIIISFVGLLSAQDFEIFLQNALEKSPYLEANRLNIEQANENANITTRYKNPTLALEASTFNPNIGSTQEGYRVGVSQAIRLWGVSSSRDMLASAQKEQSSKLVRLNRANFVVRLSSLYTHYKSRVKQESLAKEELEISTKIADISKERYENGTIAKVKYIQAKVDRQRVENSLSESRIAQIRSYYALLSFAGMQEEVEIETNYEFHYMQKDTFENSAELDYIKSRTKSFIAEAELNSNKIEWISLFGEFEKEPGQAISRVGVNIPLALFNTKSQEKKIAELEAEKSQLMVQNIQNRTSLQLKEIDKSLVMFQTLKKSTKRLLKSQKELLSMYEDGYKVANIDLIELQMIKNQMIETKVKAIQIQLAYEQKIIQHNFLIGEYND